VILKTPRPDGDAEAAKLTEQEVEFYRVIAPRTPSPPIVRCYDAAFSPASGHGHLLLDDWAETHSHPTWPLPPSVSSCEQAIDSLAMLHARWWDHAELGKGIGRFLDESGVAEMMGGIAHQYSRFADFLGDRLSGERRRVYETILSSSLRPWKRIAQRTGLTVVHGDAHLSNFLYPRAPGNANAFLIDYAFPSIAVNENGDALIGYSRFHPEEYASAGYTFLQASPGRPHVRHADFLFRKGQSEYERTGNSSLNRWGDYSNTVVDPNGVDFWTIQMYAERPYERLVPPSRWGTYWARIKPPRAEATDAAAVPAVKSTTPTPTSPKEVNVRPRNATPPKDKPSRTMLDVAVFRPPFYVPEADEGAAARAPVVQPMGATQIAATPPKSIHLLINRKLT
jgi:hypothetical protein